MDEFWVAETKVLEMQCAKIGGMIKDVECPITNNVMIMCIEQIQLFKVLPNCKKNWSLPETCTR